MSWIMFYYIFLKPLKLLPSDEKMNEKYDDADLHPRFSFFSVSGTLCLVCSLSIFVARLSSKSVFWVRWVLVPVPNYRS